LSLLQDVARRLEAEGIGYVLIGAAAVALRDVSRSTVDAAQGLLDE
jgi:hypothetical protein